MGVILGLVLGFVLKPPKRERSNSIKIEKMVVHSVVQMQEAKAVPLSPEQ